MAGGIRTLKTPLRPVKRRWVRARRRRAQGEFAPYVARSEAIAGWARGPEAIELARVARAMPTDAVIVEIGSFLGSSAVLMAGARKVAGSGHVHCVDPFDGSGDAPSLPVYEEIAGSLGQPIRVRFDRNIRDAGLSEWVTAHVGTAEQIGAQWSSAIDVLFFDGDQSPSGALSAFGIWSPFLKPGGVIALHNSADRVYAAEHDGHRRVVVDSIRPPNYVDLRCVGSTTLARKAS